MYLRSWFNDSYNIRKSNGEDKVVVDARNSLLFPTPRAHNKFLYTSIVPSEANRKSFELTTYCLAFPSKGSGMTDTTTVRRAQYEAVSGCYLNPEVSEWLMGFPQNWTAIGE